MEGWVASFLFHLVLLLIFLSIKLDLRPFELSFTTLEFTAGGTPPSGAGRATQISSTRLPPVDLPKRLSIDEPLPMLKVPQSEKPVVEPVITAEKIVLPDEREPMRKIESWQERGRLISERPPIEPTPLSEEWLSQQKQEQLASQVVGEEMFAISWEGPNRIKISGDLPTFPPGVRRDAVIRLGFTVKPDGTVGSVAPITKGVPELERVAIETFRQWRFNRLDPTLPQVDQRGEITFRFRLK